MAYLVMLVVVLATALPLCGCCLLLEEIRSLLAQQVDLKKQELLARQFPFRRNRDPQE